MDPPSFHLPWVVVSGGARKPSLGHSHSPHVGRAWHLKVLGHQSSWTTAANRLCTSCKCASVRYFPYNQWHLNMGCVLSDTKKFVFIVKGVTGELWPCFLKKKNVHFIRETCWSIFKWNDTQSGVYFRICQQRNEEGRKGRETRGDGDGGWMKLKWQNVLNFVIRVMGTGCLWCQPVYFCVCLRCSLIQSIFLK